jgi:hypothetical protein
MRTKFLAAATLLALGLAGQAYAADAPADNPNGVTIPNGTGGVKPHSQGISPEEQPSDNMTQNERDMAPPGPGGNDYDKSAKTPGQINHY